MNLYRDITVIVISISAVILTATLRPDITYKADTLVLEEKAEDTITISYTTGTSYSYDSGVTTVKDLDAVGVQDSTDNEYKLEEVSFDVFSQKKSDDYLGSIFIPSIQAADSIYKDSGNDFYLTHNYKKSKSSSGELYLDKRSAGSITSTGALINGHSMSNGTKFGKVKDLLTEEDQPILYIWSEKDQKSYKYRINSVSLIDNENSGIVFDFSSSDSRGYYYDNMYNAAIKRWEPLDNTKPVIILNTCSYIIDQGRYLVLATLEGEVSNAFRSNN